MSFTDLINSTPSVWERLKLTNKPIMLYGMGDGATKILKALELINVKVTEIFASDEFVRGHSFCGYKVRKLSELEAEYSDFIIVLGFGSSLPELLERFHTLNKKYELYSPDLPLTEDIVTGKELFTKEYALSQLKNIEKCYSLLADEQSRLVFEDIIRYKISGKIDYLKHCETPREEMFDIITPSKNEVYFDLGAYNGDTVFEYEQNANGCKRIFAVEPDRKNFKKLCKNLQSENQTNTTAIFAPIWSEETILCFDDSSSRNSAIRDNGKREVQTVCVDKLCLGSIPDSVEVFNPDLTPVDNVTYIKMDVEGAEEQAIIGATETIKKYAPKLTISAYHKIGDFINLPLQIHNINPEYKLYLRHHPYVPAWETNLYAII